MESTLGCICVEVFYTVIEFVQGNIHLCRGRIRFWMRQKYFQQMSRVERRFHDGLFSGAEEVQFYSFLCQFLEFSNRGLTRT